MTTPNALSKPTIYDYLDDPNLEARFEENLAVPCVEERIDSEIKCELSYIIMRKNDNTALEQHCCKMTNILTAMWLRDSRHYRVWNSCRLQM